jgi:hypothetical protein
MRLLSDLGYATLFDLDHKPVLPALMAPSAFPALTASWLKVAAVALLPP